MIGCDEATAQRVRTALRRRRAFTERKMFGSVCFMLNGNMCCGVLNDWLIVRATPSEYDAALQRPHTRVLDITGRPMKGFVVVTRDGYRTQAAFRSWLETGVRCARAYASKSGTPSAAGNANRLRDGRSLMDNARR